MLPTAHLKSQNASKGPNAAYDFSQAAPTGELTANKSDMAFKAQNTTTKVVPNAAQFLSVSSMPVRWSTLSPRQPSRLGMTPLRSQTP